MASREAKKLGKRIREETGVPLGACCVIARCILDYNVWELDDLDSTKKWCKITYRSYGCDCCSGSTGVVVTGPKGTYRHE
jgi:hypothetical protein